MKKLHEVLKIAAFLIPFLGIITLFSQRAKADVILHGEKIIAVCYRVSNVSEYPDYKIIYSPVGPPGSNDAWYAEADNKCFTRLYKMADNPRFYAVPVSEFSESKLDDISKFGSSLLPSDTTINMSDDTTVPKDDPTDSITYTYKVIRIDCDKLWIYPISKEIKYVDGSFNATNYEIPSLPAPSSCGDDNNNNNDFQDNSSEQDNDAEQDTETQEEDWERQTESHAASEDEIETSDDGETLGISTDKSEKVKDIVFSPIGLVVIVCAVLGGLGLGAIAIIIIKKKLRKKGA